MALVVKNLPVNAGDRYGFGPWVRKIPGERNGNPLQYSCLENPMDRGAWWATIHGVTESDGTEVTYHTCSNPCLESCLKGIQEALLDKMQGEGASWGHLPLHVLSYADCDGLCVNQDKSWEISAGEWLVYSIRVRPPLRHQGTNPCPMTPAHLFHCNETIYLRAIFPLDSRSPDVPLEKSVCRSTSDS